MDKTDRIAILALSLLGLLVLMILFARNYRHDQKQSQQQPPILSTRLDSLEQRINAFDTIPDYSKKTRQKLDSTIKVLAREWSLYP